MVETLEQVFRMQAIGYFRKMSSARCCFEVHLRCGAEFEELMITTNDQVSLNPNRPRPMNRVLEVGALDIVNKHALRGHFISQR
jgi:hypothetical protein